MRGYLVLGAVLALAGCNPKPAEAPGAAPPPPVEEPLAGGPSAEGPAGGASSNDVSACAAPVSAAGYCGVLIGMTADAAKAAYPGGLNQFVTAADLAKEPDQCFELFVGEAGKGVSFLVEEGQVRRVDIPVGGPFTVEGFGVGTPEADIRRKHSDAKSSPNKYDETATDLSYAEGEGKVLFEIKGGKVQAFRAGSMPQVEYVEGCS